MLVFRCIVILESNLQYTVERMRNSKGGRERNGDALLQWGTFIADSEQASQIQT